MKATSSSAGGSPTFSPLYRQIKALLTSSLEAQEWKPGEAIPSEVELAARYGVSQGTVRKAIDELAGENLLVRRQGKGTFVATHAEARTQFRFLRLQAQDGGTGASVSRLLECRRTRAGAEVARALQLRAGDAIMLIRRLLVFGERPVVLDEIHLPGVAFKGLTAALINQFGGSMYNLFETEFGVRMIRAEERLRAVSADSDSAVLLEVPEQTPLLLVERIAFTYGDRPMEWRRGLYHTAEHCYRNELG